MAASVRWSFSSISSVAQFACVIPVASSSAAFPSLTSIFRSSLDLLVELHDDHIGACLLHPHRERRDERERQPGICVQHEDEPLVPLAEEMAQEKRVGESRDVLAQQGASVRQTTGRRPRT